MHGSTSGAGFVAALFDGFVTEIAREAGVSLKPDTDYADTPWLCDRGFCRHYAACCISHCLAFPDSNTEDRPDRRGEDLIAGLDVGPGILLEFDDNFAAGQRRNQEAGLLIIVNVGRSRGESYYCPACESDLPN